MALLENGKCVEIRMTNYEQPKSQFSHNLVGCIKNILKAVCNLLGGIIIVSYLTSSAFCILREDISRAHLTSALLAGAGLSCVILGIFSSKLSVTGCSRLGLLVCSILYLNQVFPPCYGRADIFAMGSDLRTEEWQNRFRTVQGGVLLVSIVEILVGIIGIDIIVKYIRPVSISPTLILLSIYVMKTCAPTLAEGCWKLFSFTCFLMFLFYLVAYRISSGSHFNKSAIRRRIFIGLFAAVLVWMMCAFFSKFEWIRLKNAARTDVYDGALLIAPTLNVPYLFQWGLPKFQLNAFFVMLPAMYISLFEILANYYITSESESNCSFHINEKRNKLIERNTWSSFLILEGVLSLLIGSIAPGLSVTVELKSTNQRLPGIITGAIMIAVATSGVFCALITTIPEPIVAAFIFLIFLSFCLEGFSLLQCVNLNSARSQFILGISLFLGILLPQFMNNVSRMQLFGIQLVDEVFWSIISTEFLIGGIVAVILDNFADVFLGSDTETKLIKSKSKLTDSADSLTSKSSSCCECFLSIFC